MRTFARQSTADDQDIRKCIGWALMRGFRCRKSDSVLRGQTLMVLLPTQNSSLLATLS